VFQFEVLLAFPQEALLSLEIYVLDILDGLVYMFDPVIDKIGHVGVHDPNELLE
jgi:hypothetical protein